MLQEAGQGTPGGDGVRLLGEAAASYRDVLKVYTPQLAPDEWPLAQSSLGDTLQAEGKRTPGDAGVRLLVEAAGAYRKLVDNPTNLDAQYLATVKLELANTLAARAARTAAKR